MIDHIVEKTEALNLEIDEQAMIETIRKIHSNLVSFRQIALQTGDDENAPANFHFQWSHLLLHGTKHEAIEGYRESAKGQYVMRSFPLYRLKFPIRRQSYIVLIKANQTLAENKLLEIEHEYSTNPLLNSNCVEIQVQSGKVFSVDVMDENDEIINVRIEAYGKGASIRGLSNLDRRPDIIIIDDPQDKEDSNSDTVLANDWDWFISDVKFLSKHCRIFLIGNNMGEKCIIEMVRKFKDELGFNFHRVPVMNKLNQPLWPARNTSDEIIKEREAYRSMGQLDVWYREKMCLAISEETRIFKKEDFRYYSVGTADTVREDCKVFCTIDLSAGEKETSDYFCIVTVGVNPDNHWFVLDIDYGWYDIFQQLDATFAAVRRWRPDLVGIEKVAYQAVFEQLLDKEMLTRKCLFDVTELKAEGEKELRIKALKPRFRTHSIRFPDQATWLAELESELTNFRPPQKILHDDVIDALAYQLQIAEPPVKSGSQPNATLPRKADPG